MDSKTISQSLKALPSWISRKTIYIDMDLAPSLATVNLYAVDKNSTTASKWNAVPSEIKDASREHESEGNGRHSTVMSDRSEEDDFKDQMPSAVEKLINHTTTPKRKITANLQTCSAVSPSWTEASLFSKKKKKKKNLHQNTPKTWKTGRGVYTKTWKTGRVFYTQNKKNRAGVLHQSMKNRAGFLHQNTPKTWKTGRGFVPEINILACFAPFLPSVPEMRLHIAEEIATTLIWREIHSCQCFAQCYQVRLRAWRHGKICRDLTKTL
jgi:hypothetical protein